MNSILDEQQKKFCEAPLGNIRLLAPAGCGKTLSILHRCLYLARQCDQSHFRFLILVFTRAARDELKYRIQNDAQFQNIRGNNVDIATLNSWGFRRVKKVAFSPRLITNKTDFHFTMLNLLRPIWRKHAKIKFAIENDRNKAPRILMDVIDAFKSLGFDHERHTNYSKFSNHLDHLENYNLTWCLKSQLDELSKLAVLETKHTDGDVEVPSDNQFEVYKAFFQFWRNASRHLIDCDTFTLEDQKYFAYLHEQAKVEQKSYLYGAAGYSHVFVDEFQDINPLDLKLIKAITQRNQATLTITGDDDQAIFEWRGATPKYILNPEELFEVEFSTFILQKNYRSPANIVEHSKYLIENNKNRVKKEMIASSQRNAKIEVREFDRLQDTLDKVADVIKNTLSKVDNSAKVAIIGRKRSQIIPYQIYFASKNIPFCAAEDLSVFLSKAFERLIDLIKIKECASTAQSTHKVVVDILNLCDLCKRYPLKKSDREQVKSHLTVTHPASLYEAIEALGKYSGPLKGSNDNGRMSHSMAGTIKQFVNAGSVSDTLRSLSNNFDGLRTDIGKAEDDIFYTDPPFQQLEEFASSYGNDYQQFVEDIILAKEQLVHTPSLDGKSSTDEANERRNRPVHLMTALRAKGKEFNTVILLDVNDDIWPNINAESRDQLEAERRVFYVAFTRVREHIILLVNRNIKRSPSLYIDELKLPNELKLPEKPSFFLN